MCPLTSFTWKNRVNLNPSGVARLEPVYASYLSCTVFIVQAVGEKHQTNSVPSWQTIHLRSPMIITILSCPLIFSQVSYPFKIMWINKSLPLVYEKRKGAWILYAVGFYVVTSAATFITHNFMVKGVLVGMELISNKKIKSIVEPVLVSTVKCWPKFLIALYGHFILFSDIGSFAIIGSVGFNLHIGVALSLLVMTGSQTRYSWLSIFKSLIILLTSVGFVSRICNIYNLTFELIALFILFCGFVMILPCIKAKCEKKSEENYEEYDLEENDESKKSEEMDNCCLPKAPLS